MCDLCSRPFLTIAEAAELLRVKQRTLDNLRWHGQGPRFRRHGGRIVYHRDELLAWSEQRAARIPGGSGKPAPAGSDARSPLPRPPGAPCLRAPLAPALAVERQR